MSAHYDYCMSWLGVPYVFGGQSRFGVDCSGLVQLLLKPNGLQPAQDMTAQGLFEYFLERSHRNIRKFGSLTFYGHNEKKINHVGFMVDGTYMIEAIGDGASTKEPTPGQSVELSLITRRKDLVAVLYPFQMK